MAVLQPWSKAGIIIKAAATEGSAYAAMMVTGSHGVRMQWDYTNDVAGLGGAVSAASPRGLRLTRSGDTITGYDSLAAFAVALPAAFAAPLIEEPLARSRGIFIDPVSVLTQVRVVAGTAALLTVAAIGVMLGLLYLFPIVGAVLGGSQLARHLQQIGPMSAGLAIRACCSAPIPPAGHEPPGRPGRSAGRLRTPPPAPRAARP